MSRPPLHLRRPARILVTVRESPFNALIAEVLSLEGYDVTTTTSADEALRIARQSREGLIIFLYVLDPGWPGYEGLAIFTTQRRPDDGHVVILLVASPGYSAELHADDILSMPFTTEELLQKTARAQRLFRTRTRGDESG
jgi:DNA-binding response OmpR family regulator